MRRFRIFIWRRSPRSVGFLAPGVTNASISRARTGLQFRYEGRAPGVANASTAWGWNRLEFRGADLWPIFGDNMEEMEQ